MNDDRLSVHEAGALRALIDLTEEMERAETKFPGQHHPDGTGHPFTARVVDAARGACQLAARDGRCTWRLILAEEVTEAYAETDPDRLRAELLQVATVALRWVIDIDGRARGAE